MGMAEIIQKTYVEYLPDGRKRDRYRKKYIPKNQHKTETPTTPQTKNKQIPNKTSNNKKQT